MRFGMGNKERAMRKAGVSLITVLLFMLVATIAATATYKWITSEGRSSASRMMEREAYQSSIAGIENARSWMTFHANDVGALVRQYLRDNNHRAINLDGRLRSLTRPGQNYHVWLVGVNTENSTYKLKILSSGESRNGSRHSEVAIFNVDGLYQVRLPVIQNNANIDFEYAYYGGSFTSTQVTATSAIVNGHWSGNPPVVTGNWVVTGNATLSGNNISVGGTTCIGGNASTENNGISTTDFYVGGNFEGLVKNATGSVYFAGNAKHGGTGSINIGGNLTVDGFFTTAQNATDRATYITGNLCVSDSGAVISNGTSDVFSVGGNVWMPGPQNIWYGTLEESGCTCEVYSTYWQTNGQLLRTESCNGNWETYPEKGILVGCANKKLITDDSKISTNRGAYDKIVLGGSQTSMAYIASKISASDYLTMRNSQSKTFTESTNKKKYCPTPISENDEWSIKIGDGGSNNYKYAGDPKNICGSWDTPEWHTNFGTGNDGYYAKYHLGWKNWSDGQTTASTYKPYYSISNTGSDRYSIYHTESGVTDVSFGDYNLTDWKYFNCSGSTHSNCIQGDIYQIKLVYSRDDNDHAGYRVFKPDPSSAQIGLKFKTPTPIGAYYVGGNVFYDLQNYNGYHYDVSSGKVTGSPYCKKGTDQYRPECGVTPWFKSNGTVSSIMPSEREFSCAESVKQQCFSIWQVGNGCENTKFVVPDPLITAYDKYEEYAHKGCAANITSWGQSGFETALNNCYSQYANDEDLAKQNLYNGYLVVHITGNNPGQNYSQSSGTPLNGKFIIIVDEKLKAGQNGLPATTGSTNVFIYLKKGADYIQKDARNYFIYTEGDIGNSSGLNLSGTLYSPVASCAKSRFQDSQLTFNAQLIQDLANAGIICQNDGGATCTPVNVGGGAGGGAGVVANGGWDSYYISMAPQLGVSLESQYENNETMPAGANQAALSQSFIVLPRVIYIPNDPYGTLSDYYNVVPLNGSNLGVNDVQVVCGGGIPVAGALYNGVALPQGVFACNATANGYNNIPFWVVVNGSQRGTPSVRFVESVQEMPTTGSAEVHANIPPHAQPITLLVSCPSVPAGWLYNPVNGTVTNGTCSFVIPANNSNEERKLFDVTTSDASNGTVMFQLLAGEGYALANPFSSELFVSNVATIIRDNPTMDEINAYCSNYPENCPEEGHRSSTEWPDCNTNKVWVEPSTFAAINDTNDSWTVPAGGAGELNLQPREVDGCIIIIPSENNSLDRSTVVADREYRLRAIAKAKKLSVRVGFTGNVGTGNNPQISIDANSRTATCEYNNVKDDSPMVCAIDLYNGETVKVSISKEDGNSENFSYWKCENNGGHTCPTLDPVTSAEYNNFTIQDNNAILYAHFGEADKHCFFDEFKHGSVECSANNDEYCVDKCGNDDASVCGGAIDGMGVFAKAKWHLVEGKMEDIESDYEHISIDNVVSRNKNRSSRDPVKVLSTVNAGIYGTLKALVQLPKVTSGHGNSGTNVAQSGFMLRSNNAGSEHLMLNVYVNASGKLEARLCPDEHVENCVVATPKKDGNPLSVSVSDMVMVEATLTKNNTLDLTVFSGNFYGEPDEYTYSFDLATMSRSYSDRAHEFIGFSMADPNFKIYGIGWKSLDYASECYDTYPTVKCSFAAAATQGVVPTTTTVEPWIGHSGWFDSKSCTPVYYYVNGTDACSGQSNSESTCSSAGYYFSVDGAGQHGYRDAYGHDVKTAKAWLSCTSPDDQVVAWSAGTEALRAHCGLFWTGAFTECLNHVDFGALSSVNAGSEGTLSITGTANLRGSKLNVTLENPDSNPVEIWLLSENDVWGSDDFASPSVKITGTSGSFDVLETFAEGSQGFDPEHVKQVVVKNLGETAITNVVVTAACKNAVGISDCSTEYDETLGKWIVRAEITNKGNVTAYSVVGQVNSSDVVSTTAQPDEWSGDIATWKIADNPYGSHQNDTYEFSAKVTNSSNEQLETSCGSVTIGGISCSNVSVTTPIASGAAWPTFSFKLNGCPHGECDFDIYFDDVKLSGNTDCTSGSCSGTDNGSVTRTRSGNAEECTTDGGCTHKYSVVSSNNQKPFTACEASFKVSKKTTVVEYLETTCRFNATVTQPGANGNFKADVYKNGIDIRNRDYILLSAAGDTAKKGNLGGNSELSFDISGIWTAKSGDYTLKVKDNNGVYQVSCVASLSVGSPNITCSTINESGTDKFKIAVGQPCANNACPWKLVKDENMSSPISSGDNLANSEYKIGFSGYGVYKLYVNNEAVSGCSITREAPRPSVTCPSAKQNYTIDLTATFKAASVANCGDGCDYRLERTSGGTAFASTANGTGTYTSASTGITFPAPSSTEDDIAYTFTIYDKNNHDRWDSCQGTMAFVESSSSAASSSSAGASPAETPCYMAQFYYWGESVQFKFENYNEKYKDKDYVIKNGLGTTCASGTANNNQIIVENLNSSCYASNLSYTLFIDGLEICTIQPDVGLPFFKECKLDNYNISSGNNTTFRFYLENCKNNKCSYVVKRDGTAIETQNNVGDGGKTLTVNTSGTYVVWLNGVETSCSVPLKVSGSGPSEPASANCYFPQTYNWGEKITQLKVDNPNEYMKNKSYEVKNAQGTSLASGTGNNSQIVDVSLDKYYAGDGIVTLYVGGDVYCAVKPIVKKAYFRECKLDNYNISSGNNTTFRFYLENCKNDKCSYVVKRDGTAVETKNNVSDGGKTLTVSTSGTYVVWLNNEETGCKATLNVQ